MTDNKFVRINFALTPAASSSSQKDLMIQTTTDDNGLVTRDFGPFKNVTVINSGTTDVTLVLNDRQGYDYIPAGTIFTIEDDLISKFVLTNTSGAAAAAVKLILDNRDTVKSILSARL